MHKCVQHQKHFRPRGLVDRAERLGRQLGPFLYDLGPYFVDFRMKILLKFIKTTNKQIKTQGRKGSACRTAPANSQRGSTTQNTIYACSVCAISIKPL